MKLVHHGLRIRPVCFVEFPVSLQRPVEKVDNDLVNLNAFLLVLSCYRKHLFLGTVAQLALPKAHQFLRKLSGTACHRRIIFKNLPWIFPGRDPIIHLFCRSGDPFIVIVPERDPSYRRIVPQKAITKGRNGKRNADLGIAVGKL